MKNPTVICFLFSVLASCLIKFIKIDQSVNTESTLTNYHQTCLLSDKFRANDRGEEPEQHENLTMKTLLTIPLHRVPVVYLFEGEEWLVSL